MRLPIRLTLAAALAASSLLAATGVASAARAIVIKDEAVACRTEPGDVGPGSPGFPLSGATVVILSSGVAILNCQGTSPDGLAVEQTIVNNALLCSGPPGYETNTTGRLTATPSGRVSFQCIFQPSP